MGIWRRRGTPSFWRSTSQCAFAVLGEIPRRTPTSSFEYPAAISSTTSRCRGVMGVVFRSVASSIMAPTLLPRSRDDHSSGGVSDGVSLAVGGARAHFVSMAAMDPRSTRRPHSRTVALVLGGAAAVAVALVAVSLVRSNTGSTPPVTANPVVNLTGIPQAGRILGSPKARVTLVEYADPQCPGCRAYTETIFPVVVNEYVRTGKLKTEFRGYPFLGEDSVKAYRFLLAAARQNKLWNLQEAMYRNQGAENSGWVTDELVRRLAAQIPGLDVTRLFADAEGSDIRTTAEDAADAASEAGIQGTPSFLIQTGNAPPYLIEVGSAQDMRAALDDALSG